MTRFIWYSFKLISILLLLELPFNILIPRVGDAKDTSSCNNLISSSLPDPDGSLNEIINNINYFNTSLLKANNSNLVFSKIKHNRVYILAKTILPKEIVWVPGVIWRQQFITVKNKKGYNIFPVNLLEIDNKSSKVVLRPITSNLNGQIGTSSLEEIAKKWRVVAAINGGFFNRNNRLPLGAIRHNNDWLSSPILGRGAVGWNENGKFFIDHLSLKEFLILNNGERISIQSLNSGYIQAGISRYTKEWGERYETISNNEIACTASHIKAIKMAYENNET